MRIGPLGTREVVALGLLIIAVIGGISVTLLRPEDEAETEAAQERIDERTQAARYPNGTPTPTEPPEPTATALPAVGIKPPEAWIIRYETASPTGGFTPEGQYSITALDLSFAAGPFPDVRDNQWRAVLAGQLDNERPGPWTFTIEYQGSIKVFVSEDLVAEGSADKPTKLEVSAPSRDASSSIRIEAQDTGGNFLLRWK